MESKITCLILISDKFQSECLSVANKYRGKHSAPALRIDNKVTEFAKSRCKIVSKPGYLDGGHDAVAPSDHGENIYRTTAAKVESCAKVIDKWYSENKFYKYKTPSFDHTTAHFVQLVWKASTKIGCAQCSGGGEFGTYVVCSFKVPADSKSVPELKVNVRSKKNK